MIESKLEWRDTLRLVFDELKERVVNENGNQTTRKRPNEVRREQVYDKPNRQPN